MIYEFGDFRLDTQQRLLFWKADGRTLPLVSRAFDVLLHLVMHAGTQVSKADLMKAVWPDTIVEDNNLSQSIAAIRRALGEQPGEHKYIVTIPGRGFRFVASVQTKESSVDPDSVPISAPTRSVSRWMVLVPLVAAIAAVTYFSISPRQANERTEPHILAQTLAILPFKPIASSDGNESLQYGMADTLISRLQTLEGVAVQPFSSVRRYGGTDQDALAAARQLNVASVLDGTIQRNGDRLRVTARLLNVADGRQLWSENFEEKFTDIFTVQDAIAGKVTSALALRLTKPTQQRLKRRYTDDAEAYQLYVNGWFQRSRTGEDGFKRSIEFYKQAIARDPLYPLPYVGLADSYAMLGVFGIAAPDQVYPLALAAVTKALEIDNDLGEAHASLAHIKVQYERDFIGAEREYQRALTIAPNYAIAHMWYAIFIARSGHLDEALVRLRHAQELEPLQLGTSANIGMLLYFSRRYDDAIKQLQKVLATDPDLDHARSFLGRAYLRKGEYEQAIAEFKRRKSLSITSYADLATAYALSGRKQESLAELDRLLKLARERYVPAYDVASIYASLGDIDQAFEWLNRSVAERGSMLGLVSFDPSFDALRDDPRMTKLLEAIAKPATRKL